MKRLKTAWYDLTANFWQMKVRYHITDKRGIHEVSRKQWEQHGAIDALDKIRETAILLHIILPK